MWVPLCKIDGVTRCQKHPRAKEKVKTTGGTLRRNHLDIGRVVNMSGKESYMRKAKTVARLTFFRLRQQNYINR